MTPKDAMKVFVDLGLWRSFPQQMKIAGETVHQVTTKEDRVAPGLGAAGLSNDMNNFVLQRERQKRLKNPQPLSGIFRNGPCRTDIFLSSSSQLNFYVHVNMLKCGFNFNDIGQGWCFVNCTARNRDDGFWAWERRQYMTGKGIGMFSNSLDGYLGLLSFEI